MSPGVRGLEAGIIFLNYYDDYYYCNYNYLLFFVIIMGGLAAPSSGHVGEGLTDELAVSTHRLLSSSFLGLPYRILYP